MAQHDYVIDNQAFPATRADLNSVLQAIVTNNSGSSAPSTTFAGQIWLDTSTSTIFIRNNDNDANIPLLQLDQSADVAATLATLIDVLDASGTNQAGTALTIQGGAGTGSGAAGKILFKTAPAGSSGSSVNSHATMLAVGGSGVAIGHDSPTAELHIKGDTTDDQVIIENTNSGAANAPDLTLFRNSSSPADNDVLGIIKFDGKNDAAETTEYASIQAKADDVSDGTEDGIIIFKNIVDGTLAERMRIDGTDLLIAQTQNSSSVVGHVFSAVGTGFHIRDGNTTLVCNRLSSDGAIAEFRKDGSTAGQINSRSGDLVIGTGDAGLSFNDGNNAIIPANPGTNALDDNFLDLGTSSVRFDDIRATNGTIQTSDHNEKQDIASLTDAEINAAKEISKLFKTFKWKDKVALKGDSARTHAGVVAQEVQQAMTDAGLDATKYAFWCSDTWWEHNVEVPEVEANEENGIEAQDAYTRIDYYYTADEAPEGATEKTRLGIRYPELLAFIGAATEQRLTNIEARLTALEG